MTTKNYYEGIKHVVHISTDFGTHCEHCSTSIGTEKFAESINHYIEQHGYRLLHVGTETIRDADGNPWHTSVASLGGATQPAPQQGAQVVAIRVQIAQPPQSQDSAPLDIDAKVGGEEKEKKED